MKAHRVRYEDVGVLVPWWKLIIGLCLPFRRVHRWCLSYAVPGCALLALAACNACDKSIVVKPAPAVQWDGGADDSAHACAVLKDAGCPVGQDLDACSVALRADQQAGDPPGTASQVNLACIIDAGPNPSALRACGVTCR